MSFDSALRAVNPLASRIFKATADILIARCCLCCLLLYIFKGKIRKDFLFSAMKNEVVYLFVRFLHVGLSCIARYTNENINSGNTASPIGPS